MQNNQKWAIQLKKHQLDALLLMGTDSFVYATQTTLPYPKNYPAYQTAVCMTGEGEAALIAPEEWRQALLDQGWKGEVFSYPAGVPPKNFIAALSACLRGLKLEKKRIGIDLDHTSQQVFDLLQTSFPEVTWQSFDKPLCDLRVVKQESEIQLLEKASRFAELGIVAALNHFEGMLEAVSYSMQETTERMRVHVGEFGGSATGHMAALQGMDVQHFYVPPRGRIKDGAFLRYDLTCSYHGYWSAAARTVFVGEHPEPAYINAYQDNLLLKKTAISKLKPGISCRDVFLAVSEKANLQQIDFAANFGAGYGVGVSEREAPFINAQDETILEIGMVIVVDVITYGPHKEMIRNCDTYVIEEGGSRLLSWYRNYDRLYRVFGSTAVHG